MPRASKLRRSMQARGKSIGNCEICGCRMLKGAYPPDCKLPRLKGVCWECMKVIDKHPARGK
jgi:hypothetical protein